MNMSYIGRDKPCSYRIVSVDAPLMGAMNLYILKKEIPMLLNYYNFGSRDPLLTGKTPVTISAESPSKAEAIIAGFSKLAKDNNILVFVSASPEILYEKWHN